MSFINPIEYGYLTSGFGKRKVGGVDDFHKGVDLSHQPNSNVKVNASADGTVITAGVIGSYGNVVIVRHNIDGKTMDTLYAHLASINVKANQKVKQGECVGIMGKTGGSKANKNYSMAIHLHFEIHHGTYNSSRTNAVDPEKYIKFYSKTEVLKMKEDIQKLQNTLNAQAKTIKDLETKVNEQPSTTVATWGKEAWDWATKNKITDGTRPNHKITRLEVVVLIHRLWKLITNK